MEISGQLHILAALPPVATGLEAGWTPEPVWTWWKEKSLSLLGIETRLSSP